jgi:hypothetical protein
MGSLTQLVYLRIDGTAVVGKIPSWIANFALLKSLEWAESSFEGAIQMFLEG